MRRLVSFAIFVVIMGIGALVVGELLIKPAVERRIGDEVRDRYGLATRPPVDIDAFPFLVEAVRGELDGAEVDVVDATVEGLAVEQALVDARGIHFDLFDLLRDNEQARADRVTARVQVAEPALDQYLRDRGVPFDVTLGAGSITVAGTAAIRGQSLSGSATGTLSITNSVLRFTPTSVSVAGLSLDSATESLVAQQLTFEVPVPAVVGVTITGIEIQPGRGVLLAEATDHMLIG